MTICLYVFDTVALALNTQFRGRFETFTTMVTEKLQIFSFFWRYETVTIHIPPEILSKHHIALIFLGKSYLPLPNCTTHKWWLNYLLFLCNFRDSQGPFQPLSFCDMLLFCSEPVWYALDSEAALHANKALNCVSVLWRASASVVEWWLWPQLDRVGILD